MNRDHLDNLLKDFGQMLTTESVIGQPITIGKVTIVPVVSVSFAFGSGAGAKNEKPLATGATAGAKLAPVAFLSIHEDGSVNLHHVKSSKESTLVDRILEMVPGLIDKISAAVSKGDKKPAVHTAGDDDEEITMDFGDAEVSDEVKAEITAAISEAVKKIT